MLFSYWASIADFTISLQLMFFSSWAWSRLLCLKQTALSWIMLNFVKTYDGYSTFSVVRFSYWLSKMNELLSSLTLHEVKYEFIRLYIWPYVYIWPYIYTLPHRLYAQPNANIRPYSYMIPHLSYIRGLTRTYNLRVFLSSDLPYEVTPYGSNAVYLSLYGLIWPCMTYTALQFQV